MRQHSSTLSENGSIFFLPGVFNDTMRLLTDAQQYFGDRSTADQAHIPQHLRTLYSCEMSRITLRLSSIMAWVMAQRAVLDGKISAGEAATRYGLDFQEVCRVDNRVLHGVLPAPMCMLLDSSLDLYERVLRLHERVRQLH